MFSLMIGSLIGFGGSVLFFILSFYTKETENDFKPIGSHQSVRYSNLNFSNWKAAFCADPKSYLRTVSFIFFYLAVICLIILIVW